MAAADRVPPFAATLRAATCTRGMSNDELILMLRKYGINLSTDKNLFNPRFYEAHHDVEPEITNMIGNNDITAVIDVFEGLCHFPLRTPEYSPMERLLKYKNLGPLCLHIFLTQLIVGDSSVFWKKAHHRDDVQVFLLSSPEEIRAVVLDNLNSAFRNGVFRRPTTPFEASFVTSGCTEFSASLVQVVSSQLHDPRNRPGDCVYVLMPTLSDNRLSWNLDCVHADIRRAVVDFLSVEVA